MATTGPEDGGVFNLQPSGCSVLMHYTAVDFSTSVKLLSGDGGVSAHYLVPDPTEQTYIDAGFNDMRIFNLVDENERAWHAGTSDWAGRSNLNGV